MPRKNTATAAKPRVKKSKHLPPNTRGRARKSERSKVETIAIRDNSVRDQLHPFTVVRVLCHPDGKREEVLISVNCLNASSASRLADAEKYRQESILGTHGLRERSKMLDQAPTQIQLSA